MERALRLLWTRLHVRLYHLTGGRVLGRIAGQPVLLLGTTGRRTGRRRVTPVQFVRDGDRLLIVAANNGGPRPPQWLANLAAHPCADVEIGPGEGELAAARGSEASWPEAAGGPARRRLITPEASMHEAQLEGFAFELLAAYQRRREPKASWA